MYTNHSHHGPIFALKWNQSATRVLSAGGANVSRLILFKYRLFFRAQRFGIQKAPKLTNSRFIPHRLLTLIGYQTIRLHLVQSIEVFTSVK